MHVSSDVPDINVGPFPMLVGKEGNKGGLFDEAGVGTQPVHIPGINSDAGVNVAGGAKIGEIISEDFNLGYDSNKKNGMRKPKLLAQTRVTKPQGVSPGIKRPLKRPRQNDEDHFYFPLPGSNTDSGNPKGVNQDTGLSPSAGLLDLNLRASSAETLVDDPHPADSQTKGLKFNGKYQGSENEVEVAATIEVGAQVGVDFRLRSDVINKILGTSGNNGVDQ
ncbi:hypothetical protein L1987_70713 [Smallanthus sonchifolius]|uniref:Uncharacterized protein n=1 Tax=Smallanthus sonchifolius TaxID=185202 RepID=A0ACB9AR92_9ASTR|nr:hypothetical protein L1987_70713 [Smallanthus sonchifolius]